MLVISLHTFTLLMMIRNALWTIRLLYSLKCFLCAVICSCTPIVKHIYWNSDRTMCITIKVEFQTGSDKIFTGHVTFLESSLWGSSSHFPGIWAYHITASQFTANQVSVTTTQKLVNTMSVYDVYPLCCKGFSLPKMR